MPELPEVETVRRGLNRLIIGRKITSIKSDNPKSFPNAPHDIEQFLINAEVIDVRRRAKVLMIDLSTNYTLVIHLKMTGQLVFVGNGGRAADVTFRSNPLEPKSDQTPGLLSDLERSRITEESASNGEQNRDETRFGAGHPNDSLVGKLPDKSTRVIFEFTDGSHLYFNDQRKFGWVKLIPTLEVPNIDFMKKVGPEPLEADFNAQQFAARFKRRARTTIKAALLDQTVIAGVGNIYADESLWGAKIHPSRLVGSITNAEFKRLYTEVRAVMNLSIEKGGSTNKNYVNAEGKKGSYMDFARVFRREGLACPRCGTEIVKIRVASRGTHICPNCQQI
jgi:formamidopyrimidine-DNA glycosylase